MKYLPAGTNFGAKTNFLLRFDYRKNEGS